MFFNWDAKGITFLVALMGWMPTTLEISVWHSFWTAERAQQTDHSPSLKNALTDFHIGYWGTMVMAVFLFKFGSFGNVWNGRSFFFIRRRFHGSNSEFVYRRFGGLELPFDCCAATMTMFSTTLCCLDAFPRVMREASVMIWPELEDKKDTIYSVGLIVVALGALGVIAFFIGRMKSLIDFATTLAFVATPVFAFINLKAVTSAHMPEEFKPKPGLLIYSYVCLFFLTIFAGGFIYWRFFNS